MEESTNPFKQMEPDESCPPNLRGEIVSEIDFIRNSLTVVRLYVGELFGVALALSSAPSADPLTTDL
jgi:hypothetical protein